MSYHRAITSLYEAALTEARENNDGYALGKIYSETCTNWRGKSRYDAYKTLESALAAAANHIGDYDLSRTEWYRDEDIDCEIGDPAMTRALDELWKLGRITVGDFYLELTKVA